MANGNAIGELFGNGKGKLAVLSVVLMTLASLTSWWWSKEARDQIDGLRAYCDVRVGDLKTDVNRQIDRLDGRVDYLSGLLFRGFSP